MKKNVSEQVHFVTHHRNSPQSCRGNTMTFYLSNIPGAVSQSFGSKTRKRYGVRTTPPETQKTDYINWYRRSNCSHDLGKNKIFHQQIKNKLGTLQRCNGGHRSPVDRISGRDREKDWLPYGNHDHDMCCDMAMLAAARYCAIA